MSAPGTAALLQSPWQLGHGQRGRGKDPGRMVLRAEGNGEPGRGAGGREGGRWLRVCPVSLPPALLRAPGSGRTGDGASRALRRGALPGARCGGGMYRDCCRGPSEPRARDRRTNPAGGPCCPWAGSSGPPAAAGAVGTPSFLCWWGGAGINHAGIPQCGGSLCDFYARLKPGEVSVPASRPPALLCLRPGSLGLYRAVAVQSQRRVNAAFLPQKSSCVWGFSSSGCC